MAKAKISERSRNARMIRAIDELEKMTRGIVELINYRVKLRAETKDKEMKKVLQNEIDHMTDIVHANELTVTMNRSMLARIGANNKLIGDIMTLTKAEEEEITALRYAGLHGTPLFTKAELAKQYGVSAATISAIDRNAPM